MPPQSTYHLRVIDPMDPIDSKRPAMPSRLLGALAGVLLGITFSLSLHIWQIRLPWSIPSTQEAVGPVLSLLGWASVGLIYSLSKSNIKHSFAILAHLGLAASILAATILLDASQGLDLRLWSRYSFPVPAIKGMSWLAVALTLAVPGFLFGVSASLISRIESHGARQKIILPSALLLGFAIGARLWESLHIRLPLNLIPFVAILPTLVNGFLTHRASVAQTNIDQGRRPTVEKVLPLIEVLLGSILITTILLLWLELLTQSIWVHPDIEPSLLVTVGLALGMVISRQTKDFRLDAVIAFACISVLLILLYLWQPIAIALKPISKSNPRSPVSDLSLWTALLLLPALLMGSLIAILLRKSRTVVSATASLPLLLIGLAIAIEVALKLPSNSLRYGVILRGLPFGLLLLTAREIYQNRKRLFSVGVVPIWVLGAFILAAKVPRWDNLIASGLSKYAGYQPGKQVSIDGLLPFYSESQDGISAVLREEHQTNLIFGGQIRVWMPYHLALKVVAGHLAFLFNSDIRKVLVIGDPGLATSRAVASHRIEKVVCFDPQGDQISSGRWFRYYNQDVILDRRLVLTTKLPYQKFEAILVDGSNAPFLFHSSTSPLCALTRLAESAKLLMTPDGVLIYAIGFEAINKDHFLLMISALRSIFPEMSIWLIEPIGILLLASNRSLALDPQRLEEEISEADLQDNLKMVGLSDLTEVVAFRALDRADLLELTKGMPEITSENCDVLWNRYSGSKADPVEIMTMVLANTSQAKQLLPVEARKRFVEAVALAGQAKHMAATRLLQDLCNQGVSSSYYRYYLSNYLVEIARDLRASNRKREALSVSRMAIGAFDANPIAYYEAGLSEDDNLVAVKLLDKAISLNPDYYHAYVAKAKLQMSSGDPRSALETLGQIVTTEPLNSEVGYLRAMALIASNQISSARMLLEQILRRGNQSDEVIEALAYTLLLEGKLEKALGLYGILAKSKPKDVGILNNYATLLAEQGKLKDAIKIWKQALSLDPQNNDIRANIEEAEAKIKK